MFKLIYTLETKRKRHDWTPISKSQASSNLIKKINRDKGTSTHIYVLYMSFNTVNIIFDVAPSSKSSRPKKRSKKTSKRPIQTEHSTELPPKRRRLSKKTSEHSIIFP